MRILHVVHQYPPEHIGGTERYTMELAQQQIQAGHKVTIYAPTTAKGNGVQSPSADSTVEFRPTVKERGVAALFAANFSEKRLMRSFRDVMTASTPDLVHIQHLIGLPLNIVNEISSSGTPLVTTLHDYWFICANAQLLTNYDETICSGPNRFFNCGRCALVRSGLRQLQFLSPAAAPLMAWRNRVVRKALTSSRLLIAPTHFVKSKYDAYFNLGKKIVVIPHGIDIPDRLFSAPVIRENQLNITYVGGLSRQKGVHVLVDAVNKLPEEGIRLGIYGDTNAFPKYVDDLIKRASHPGIKVVGPVGRSELWSVLSHSDVVVVPSLWYETASLIVQEAFAAGVPVVASRIGALEERVADNTDGLLFTPGDVNDLADQLMKLYTNPELRQRLGNGIKPVRSIEEHALEIEEVYRQAARL